jgi:hypothetical protein
VGRESYASALGTREVVGERVVSKAEAIRVAGQ